MRRVLSPQTPYMLGAIDADGSGFVHGYSLKETKAWIMSQKSIISW